jgi:hypothetical protein
MRSLQSHLQAGAAAINTSSSGGPTFSLAYDSSSKPGRISQSTGKPMPPGAEFVSKAASKNAKKRANKKAKGGADGSAAGDDAEDHESAAAAAGAAGGQQSSSAAAGVAGVTEQLAGASVSGAAGGDGDAAQKRVRALQKKLRQIQQLKERRDTEGETVMMVVCSTRVAEQRLRSDCSSRSRWTECRRSCGRYSSSKRGGMPKVRCSHKSLRFETGPGMLGLRRMFNGSRWSSELRRVGIRQCYVLCRLCLIIDGVLYANDWCSA